MYGDECAARERDAPVFVYCAEVSVVFGEVELGRKIGEALVTNVAIVLKL